VGVAAYIVMGLAAGWIGGVITGRRGSGCLTTLAIGVLGSFVGGALARAAGLEGITELSVRNVLIAGLGASLLMLVFGSVERRPPDRQGGGRRPR
jgi:uncharacterized membrane protein YeaQ/YmgE (transglycosylase-associated protein family)